MSRWSATLVLALVLHVVAAVAGAPRAAAQGRGPDPDGSQAARPAVRGGDPGSEHRLPTIDVSEHQARAGHVLVLPSGGAAPRQVEHRAFDGVVYLSATDVAGFLSATRFWRAETRKLLLRIGDHRVRMGVDNPYWVIDDATVKLDPPRFAAGQVWMPIGFFLLAADRGLTPPVQWLPDERVLALGRGEQTVGALAFDERGDVTVMTLEVTPGIRPQIVSSFQDRFEVRLPRGIAQASILGRAPSLGRFASVQIAQHPGGVLLSMRVSPGTRGYTVAIERDPDRIEIRLADQWGRRGDTTFQPFEVEVAKQPPPPPPPDDAEPVKRGPLTVVIDPGHGGEDPGSSSPAGVLEKHITLEMARRLARQLGEHDGVRVTLGREHDERVDVPRRVEIANGLGADVFIVLHCDLSGPLARGRFAAVVRGSGTERVEYEDISPLVEESDVASARDVLALARWESVGREYASASLAIAKAVSDRLHDTFPDARGRILQRPIWNLEGARMPAVFLEMGVLADFRSGDPGERMTSGAYVNDAVAAIADGVLDALAPTLGAGVTEGSDALQGERF